MLSGDLDREWSDDVTFVTRGSDRFVFANNNGIDTIIDFDNGKDRIVLTAYTGIDNFAEVRAKAAQVGQDVVIDLGAASGSDAGLNTVTLLGFRLSRLDASDFVFS